MGWLGLGEMGWMSGVEDGTVQGQGELGFLFGDWKSGLGQKVNGFGVWQLFGSIGLFVQSEKWAWIEPKTKAKTNKNKTIIIILVVTNKNNTNKKINNANN